MNDAHFMDVTAQTEQKGLDKISLYSEFKLLLCNALSLEIILTTHHRSHTCTTSLSHHRPPLLLS